MHEGKNTARCLNFCLKTCQPNMELLEFFMLSLYITPGKDVVSTNFSTILNLFKILKIKTYLK